jgi:hypothetical protein
LARLWGGRFTTRDAWHAAMAASGFEIETTDDLTHDFLTHFGRLIAIARSHGSSLYPAHETEAFEHAIRLASTAASSATSDALGNSTDRLAPPDRARERMGKGEQPIEGMWSVDRFVQAALFRTPPELMLYAGPRHSSDTLASRVPAGLTYGNDCMHREELRLLGPVRAGRRRETARSWSDPPVHPRYSAAPC